MAGVAEVLPGTASVWLTTAPLTGIHAGYLEGDEAVLCWLFVEFGVAIDGAFSTNYTRDRQPAPLAELLGALHGSEVFAAPLIRAVEALGIERASFAIALYDLELDPKRLYPAGGVGMGTPYLTFAGAYAYA